MDTDSSTSSEVVTSQQICGTKTDLSVSEVSTVVTFPHTDNSVIDGNTPPQLSQPVSHTITHPGPLEHPVFNEVPIIPVTLQMPDNSDLPRDLVEENQFIKHCDSQDGLDLFCYTDAHEGSEEIVRKTRGLVFDGDHLVSRGFSFTPEYPHTAVPEHLLEQVRQQPGMCGYSRVLEGTVVRVFCHNGKWHLITNRKLDAFKSRWSSKKSFGDIFVDSLIYLYEKYKNFRDWLATTDRVNTADTLAALQREYAQMYREEASDTDGAEGTPETKGSETKGDLELGNPLESSSVLKFMKWVAEPQEYDWTPKARTDLCESFVDHLDPEYQYSFIVRSGEETRIVWDALDHPEIYLVACFALNGSIVPAPIFPIPAEYIYHVGTAENLDRMLSSLDHIDPKKEAGLVFFLPNGCQFKVYGEKYYRLFELRGNEPSIKFRYLAIRTDPEKNKMYRELYPKSIEIFDRYENILVEVARDLLAKYKKRFIQQKYLELSDTDYPVVKGFYNHAYHMNIRTPGLTHMQQYLDNQNPTTLNRLINEYILQERKNARAAAV
jgi:hypothetical protein